MPVVESEERSPIMSYASPTLESIPTEVQGHIAYFVATPELKGPPSYLPSLCRTSKLLYASLSFPSNPSLYAAIFRFKFDTAAPSRRLGSESTNSICLAFELRRRFQGLKRIRDGVGSQISNDPSPEDDLWMAIFMMLENDGKNAIQLKQFALAEHWLLQFFLGQTGRSCALNDIYSQRWPIENQENTLAMWLLWLCDADGTSLNYPFNIRRMYCDMLRAYALCSSRYPLTTHFWADFSHPCESEASGRYSYNYYNLTIFPITPPISILAILGYITRRAEEGTAFASPSIDTSALGAEGVPISSQQHTGSTQLADTSLSKRWDCSWERCIGPAIVQNSSCELNRFYCPGTLEGVWEGLFTYTEFSVHAALLSGAPPHVLQDRSIGKNLHTWKLREYNLYSSAVSGSSSNPLEELLPPGEALNAFFPPVVVEEKEDHVIFTQDSTQIIYSRTLTHPNDCGGTLRDVIVFGEGHSSWGDFKLRGRVRANDAFVTILKEYSGVGDRGRWLYRGHLVGGRLAGRWRDVLNPLSMERYGGTFELSQRS